MACVLVTEIMDPSGTSILKNAGHDVVEGWTLSADELGARYPDIDAIMVRTNKIPADMMAQMPNLKIVSKHGVGCDNIDVTYARANNIAVAIAVDANADSVAEHTLMFMLMLAKIRVRWTVLCGRITAFAKQLRRLILALALCWLSAMAG